jgi:hypothetical protein
MLMESTTDVLDIRQDFALRRHYDGELERWVQELRKDAIRNEFDLEMIRVGM